MQIERTIDIEDEVRKALDGYIPAYCRPLPEDFATPCILITQVGGSEDKHISTFDVTLDARAETELAAMVELRNAVGVLKAAAKEQSTAIRYVAVNSSGAWGSDPERPDLAMCSARVRITAHNEITEV